MRFATAATCLASLICVAGCKSFTETVLVGGQRVVYYPAGTEVPAVSASDNVEGHYSLTASELNAILNP